MGTISSNDKGDRRERELVNALDELGFAVMRAPASGSATERELPDVLAGNGEVFYAIESKASASKPIYIDEKEVEDLKYFSRKFGANPRIGAIFDVRSGDPPYGVDADPGFRFMPPDSMHRTGEGESGNYRIKKENVWKLGIPITEL